MAVFAWFVIVMLLANLTDITANVASLCCKHSGTLVDCSGCQLENLPVSEIDKATTELDLRDNNITSIPNNIFDKNYKSLTHLVLLDNPLQLIQTDSFKGKVPTSSLFK